jgi:Nuclease-related domain
MAANTSTTSTSGTATAKPPERATLTPSMSVAEARQVRWQGNGEQGPMGQLLDKGAIGPKNLLWELNNAYRPDAQEAARVLLIHHLGQPEVIQATQRYGPHVYGSSKYLEEKQYDSLLTAVFYVFGAILLAISVIYWLVSGTVSVVLKGAPWLLALTALALVILLSGTVLVPLAWWLRCRIQNEFLSYRNYRSGREAEEAVLEELRASLDNNWTIFRNLALPSSKKQGNGDMDVVLVGPSGVYVLEIKSHKSTLRVANGVWQSQTGNKWKTLRPDPSAQARGNAASLNDYLNRHGITKLWVEPVVVLTEPQPVTNFADRRRIWLHFDLQSKIRDLSSGVNCEAKPFDDANCRRIVSILHELVPKSVTA